MSKVDYESDERKWIRSNIPASLKQIRTINNLRRHLNLKLISEVQLLKLDMQEASNIIQSLITLVKLN